MCALEEMNEDLDVEALQNKGSITAADVIEVIKNIQAELQRKTVTHSDLDALRESMDEVERNAEKMLEKTLKDLELKENIEELASMPSKIKALQMENLRNENMLT